MKWPFKKNSECSRDTDSCPKECDHKFTDIKINGEECWYITDNIEGRTLRYTIYEPYVCIHCKQRKNVVLEGPIMHTADSNSQAWKLLEEIKEKYPQIKERAIVEDAVNDFQLVDRNYLQIAATVMGVKL